MHMRHATLAAALMLAFGVSQAADPAACTSGSALTYPVTAKVAQSDNYHGTTVADPYRWLEDANSAETKGWVDAQNAVTQAYLGQIPQREAIRQRLTKLWNYERYSVPSAASVFGSSSMRGASPSFFIVNSTDWFCRPSLRV